MKRTILFLAVTSGILALNGCSSWNDFTQSAAPYTADGSTETSSTAQQLPREQICAELKRKIIFSQSDLNMNVESRLPTQKAKLYDQYTKYNCQALEKQAPTSP